ncbi:DUF3500 domain-containing protein [Mycobacterium sp. WMMD1722]|uniref:DUF3500 domain-containing protein n=1 Tax=Mycobacterium sp. WMMD1722 TaxID=3404117 RepID=UPI003BF5C5F5
MATGNSSKPLPTASSSGDPKPATAIAGQMAERARAWLNTLSDSQIALALLPAPSQQDADRERRLFFYVPTDHGGLTLEQQDPHQRQLAMILLASGLSREGYVAAAAIMGLENILDLYEDFSIQWDFPRGRDTGRYYVRIFGDPRESGTWSWRFGGHHLSINVLVIDGEVAATTPFFLGADPASSPLPGGGRYSPLGGIEALAFQFAASLDGVQRSQMQLLDRAVGDIVTGNRDRLSDGDEMMITRDLFRGRLEKPELLKLADGIYTEGEEQSGFTSDDHRLMAYTVKPKGLAASDLAADQQQLLHNLVAAASSGVRVDLSSKGTDPLADMHIAWGGPLDGTPAYFRLQAGAEFLYEYDNTQRKGNHVHSVLRNPLRDFGIDLLKEHYAQVPHS